MAEALVPDERSATGKFKLIQECLTNNKFEFIWKALKNFKTMSLQVIEGTLKVKTRLYKNIRIKLMKHYYTTMTIIA